MKKKTLLVGVAVVALAALSVAAANASKGRGKPPAVSHRQAESREQFRADMVEHLKQRGRSGWKLTALGEAITAGLVDPTDMTGGKVGGGTLATSGDPVTDDEPRSAPDLSTGGETSLMLDGNDWGGWGDFLVGLMCDWGVPGLVTFVSGPGVYKGYAGLVNIVGESDTPESVVSDCHYEQCEGFAWGFPDAMQRLLFIQVNGPSYAYPGRWGCLW